MSESKKHKRMKAMSQAKRRKQVQAERISKGLCTVCGKPVDTDGRMCSSCRERSWTERKKRQEWYKAHGLCPVCGKYEIFPQEAMCPECNAKRQTREEHRADYNRKYQKMLREKRKAAGVCVECGKNKPEEGERRCKFCKEKRRQARKKKPKKYVVANRISDLLCARCDEPALPGKRLCERHYNMMLEATRKREEQYANGEKERKLNPKWKGTNKDLIIHARKYSRPPKDHVSID